MYRHFPQQRLLRCSAHSARRFTVLAFESSADDTCVAIVDSTKKIHSNVVIKQHDVHEAYGGIYPWSAIASHQKNMPLAVQQALEISGLDLVRGIDGIAFTRGPGMPGCLSVGMNAAKSLAAALGKPLVGVHHMQAHALTPLLTSHPDPPRFPFLSLLVSGGHSMILLATSNKQFKVLATTGDESIGRTFDKVSTLLKLRWTDLGPGDALEKFIAETDGSGEPEVLPFPRAIPGQLKFSFSAYHSHAKGIVDAHGDIDTLSTDFKRAVARSFQTATVGHLEEKLVLALKWCQQENVVIRDIVVSGGVASNSFLRSRLRHCLVSMKPVQLSLLHFPPTHLCTDNAVMIAWASMHRFEAADYDEYGINLEPKWNIEALSQ